MSYSVASVIMEYWRKWRKLIDDRIRQVLRELGEAEVVNVASYICEGGKRFRGFLTLLVADAMGGVPENAVDAAVAVELVHAASLALDDIIDLDYERRGRPAAWVAKGVSKTVMVSNLLIPYAQRIVLERYGTEALRRTIRAWLEASRGEVCDAFSPNACGLGYLELVRLKTGSLFRLASELGAIAAGGTGKVDLIAEYGEMLGIAYQVADDIADAANPKTQQPGLALFLEWCGKSIAKAVEELRRMVERIEEYAHQIIGDERLIQLPRFTVNVILEKVGVRI